MSLICIKMKLQEELIFIWRVSHLNSFWSRGTKELGNGLFYHRFCFEKRNLKSQYERQKSTKHWQEMWLSQSVKFAFEKEMSSSHSIWTGQNIFELEINVHINNIQINRLRQQLFMKKERSTALNCGDVSRRNLPSELTWHENHLYCHQWKAWTRERAVLPLQAAVDWANVYDVCKSTWKPLTSKKWPICFIRGLLRKGKQSVLFLFV